MFRLDRDRAHGAKLVDTRRQLESGGQPVDGEPAVHRRQHPRAGLLERVIHGVGQRAVGAGRPVLAAGPRGAGQHFLSERGEDDLGVLGDGTGGAVDAADDVLGDGRRRPQELAGLTVERIHHPGFARHAGDHPAAFARPQTRIDPGHGARIGRHRRVDQQPLIRMVQVPVVVEVLVIPADLAGIAVDGERRVVIEVLVLDTAEHELRRRRGHGRADIHEVQFRVVAGHHPGPDVHPLFVGHAAPGLVAWLPGRRDGPAPPQLVPGACVVGHDDARFWPSGGPTAPSRDDLAVGNDRT